MRGLARTARGAAILMLALAYVLLAHYTNTSGKARGLGAAVALAPLLAAALSLAWHARLRLFMLGLFMAGCVALFSLRDTLEHYTSWIYWGEHAGTQLALCALFGRTLGHGREPLCTGFARIVHGELAPALERYTRRVTLAWAMFFAAMAATSSAIFFAAPLATWSAFSNFFTAPLIGLMFVVEYLVRRHLHPEMEHAHILDGVKLYWNAPAR